MSDDESQVRRLGPVWLSSRSSMIASPMGDLGRLLVSDLTQEDRDTFFGVLEEL